MNDEEIIDQYNSLIKYIASHTCYSSASLDDNDLCQVGKMALLRAYKEYDPSCGGNIKSFLTKSIRRAIHNEAARFLGIFTVDHRVTALISKVVKLSNSGKTDDEIAVILDIDSTKVRDLRYAYKYRVGRDINNEDIMATSSKNINDLVQEAIKDELDGVIFKKRILGTVSIQRLSNETGLSKKVLYERESDLKIRIKSIIENAYGI